MLNTRILPETASHLSTNIIPVCKVAPTFHLAPATPPPPRQPIYNLSNVSCCLSITLLENANKRVLLPT